MGRSCSLCWQKHHECQSFKVESNALVVTIRLWSRQLERCAYSLTYSSHLGVSSHSTRPIHSAQSNVKFNMPLSALAWLSRVAHLRYVPCCFAHRTSMLKTFRLGFRTLDVSCRSMAVSRHIQVSDLSQTSTLRHWQCPPLCSALAGGKLRSGASTV